MRGRPLCILVFRDRHVYRRSRNVVRDLVLWRLTCRRTVTDAGGRGEVISMCMADGASILRMWPISLRALQGVQFQIQWFVRSVRDIGHALGKGVVLEESRSRRLALRMAPARDWRLASWIWWSGSPGLMRPRISQGGTRDGMWCLCNQASNFSLLPALCSDDWRAAMRRGSFPRPLTGRAGNRVARTKIQS